MEVIKVLVQNGIAMNKLHSSFGDYLRKNIEYAYLLPKPWTCLKIYLPKLLLLEQRSLNRQIVGKFVSLIMDESPMHTKLAGVAVLIAYLNHGKRVIKLANFVE